MKELPIEGLTEDTNIVYINQPSYDDFMLVQNGNSVQLY